MVPETPSLQFSQAGHVATIVLDRQQALNAIDPETGAALVAYCFTVSATRGTTFALCLAAGFAAVASVASFSRLVVAQPAWLAGKRD